ncbi:DUF7507 domain-containing protein [Leifsonia xyli]|uniref:DUF7507 domain-containing protein n=1 Tax=Leifsonia xyli TaxID=1575 RepID=UPI003D668F09
MPPPAQTDTPLVQGPAIALTKSVDASGVSSPARAGDPLTYTFVSTNTGNVILTGVTITDPLPGLSALSYTWPGTAGTLLPGQSVSATATYALTQADINAGGVDNTATTAGTPPSGPAVTDTDSASVPLAAAPALTLAKAADASALQSPPQVGDTITYRFTTTNTGNVTMTGVSVTDPLPGLSTLTYAWPGAAGVLQPGQSVVATGTYRLTQADLDAGHVANAATSTGTPPSGPPTTTPPSQTDTPLAAAPAIDLVKTADVSAVELRTVPGDTVTYRFTATNTGNVTLTGVTIADPLPGLSALTYTWPGTPGTLLPGQSVSATATYQLTQADIDAGRVDNTATTTGTPPTGPAVTDSDSATVPLTASPALSLAKAADASQVGTPAMVGDTVEYLFSATNTGNVTLTGVSITDPLAGLSPLVYAWPGAAGVLLPGQQVTAAATYQLTQADIDAGHVANAATATGTPPSGPPTTTPPSSTDTPLASAASIVLVKTADSSAVGNPAHPGDTVTYTFESINSGNVTLTGVTITDPLPGLSALTYTWPGTPGTLQPGQSVTATATYRLTQADIDAGHVANTATTAGTPPSGPAVTDDATADVPVTVAPALGLVKTADSSAVQNPARPGDTITYRFVATNAGTVTLTGVAVTDPLPGLSALTYVWPGAPGTLTPGQSVTATATYALTQADIDAGHVANAASAEGTPPSGPPTTTPPSGTDTPLVTDPAISLQKVADASAVGTPARAGDTVTYRFTSTNTGTVTLTNVSITDPLPGLSALTYAWPGASGVLAPGQSVTATATYALRQADIDAGRVANTASTTGTPPTGAAVTDDASATVPLSESPAIGLTKTADPTDEADFTVGTLVTYTFTVTNTGNVTLTDPKVVEGRFTGSGTLSPITCPSTPSLAPGARMVCTATYTLTQADVDAGFVLNDATATGVPPSGTRTESAPADAVVPTLANPSIVLVKSADASAVKSPSAVGDVITYTFISSNNGNVTLTNVSITDPLPGLSALTYSWPGTPGTLAPGQSVHATATYRLTQADIDAGHVANTATTTGTPRTGADVTDTSSTDTPLTVAPQLVLVKTADASQVGSPAHPGDTITYHFAVRNTGNVTIEGVAITDQLAGLSALSYSWPGTPGTLLPGQTVTATATYQLTQADIDAGHVANLATANGRTSRGDPLTTPPATVDMPLTAATMPTVSG